MLSPPYASACVPLTWCGMLALLACGGSTSDHMTGKEEREGCSPIWGHVALLMLPLFKTSPWLSDREWRVEKDALGGQGKRLFNYPDFENLFIQWSRTQCKYKKCKLNPSQLFFVSFETWTLGFLRTCKRTSTPCMRSWEQNQVLGCLQCSHCEQKFCLIQ